MNILHPEKKKAVIIGLLEGNSVRSVSRMTGVHKKTILKVLNEAGKKCRSILDAQMRQLSCDVIEADELWTFVKKKQRRLSDEEKLNPELGDQYIFLGIDPRTKLIPVFTIGKRDAVTTTQFIAELKTRLNGSTKLQITTDGFKPYIDAIERTFGADVHFAQLNKVYASR